MNQEMLAETSNKIRKSNVRVILDHFGAKESTVAILTIMEFDGLKIDKKYRDQYCRQRPKPECGKSSNRCLLSAGEYRFQQVVWRQETS